MSQTIQPLIPLAVEADLVSRIVSHLTDIHDTSNLTYRCDVNSERIGVWFNEMRISLIVPFNTYDKTKSNNYRETHHTHASDAVYRKSRVHLHVSFTDKDLFDQLYFSVEATSDEKSTISNQYKLMAQFNRLKQLIGLKLGDTILENLNR